MSSQGHSPSNMSAPEPHLSRKWKYVMNTSADQADLFGTRRWVCKECSVLITRGTSAEEYGHVPSCDHSIRRRDSHNLDWQGGDQ